MAEARPVQQPAPPEEPDVRGTLFLTLIFLAMVFGFWIIVYLMLLNR
ncbi:cytochrome c oxidase subunit 2A [Rhodothermus bifroesti]|jgi:hypothetical protein|uniref:Cytochrome c oxidase subunit 2A n=1 Tax=Rhodothermus marinus TaxID=29549 RepID=A0A7V2AYL3_RHOMR|nr:cytochrome c oxidase subunit 2A [Rhodothermus bifroesti]GBD02403.1 hypothetical protein HRbin18_02144 [bacterium HR18]